MRIAKKQKWYDMQVTVQMMARRNVFGRKKLCPSISGLWGNGKVGYRGRSSRPPCGEKAASEVRIHPYGNESRLNRAGDLTPKSGLNAHVHKEMPGSQPARFRQLNDRGIQTTNLDETHIGAKNPKDLPLVRNRPHGDGI